MIREEQIHRQVTQLLLEAEWNEDDLLEEQAIYFQGRVMRPDIVLCHNLYPLAVVEVKRHSDAPPALATAADQAGEYAEAIDVPFAFATDGNGIVELRLSTGEQTSIASFPSPSDLWSLLGREWSKDDPRLFPPYRDPKTAPRIHHAQAVSQAVEAIVNGGKRALISMPVGTGMTYVAFQIAWKLLQSHYCHRMLYLSDRVELAHQVGRVFEPFEESLLMEVTASTRSQMVSAEGKGARRVHINTVAYLTNPREAPRFQELAPDFYDLIIVQNAEHQSAMPVLEHFHKAIIVGFTSRDVPGLRTRQFYDQSTFAYSLEEALATQGMYEVPVGFNQTRLDEIAEIRSGIVTGQKKAMENLVEMGLHLISARDLGPDGAIDPRHLSRIRLDDAGVVDEAGEIDARYLLQADDILVARFTSGPDIRVGIAPQNLPYPTTFSNSLIRIRVNPKLADPKDVFAFLRSDSGRLMIRRYATRLGSAISQISIRELRQIPILLPKTRRARETAQEELGAASMTKQLLQREILPLIEELEEEGDRGTEDYGQQLDSIATRLRGWADVLAPPKLADRVMMYYPTPIALAYRRFHDARFNVYEQVLRLKDVFESAAFYVYNLVLADLFRRLDPSVYYIANAGARRAYNGYSVDTRMDFVEEVIKIARANRGEDLFTPELVDSSVPALAKKLQEDLRNRLSHTATAAERQQHRILADFEPIVESMLSELDFLNRYRLVRVTSYFYEKDRLVRRMEAYHGVVPELDEQIFPNETKLTRADRNHLVLLDAEGQVLDLYPLYQIVDSVSSEEPRDESHLCFFKQRKEKKQLLEGESVQGAFSLSLPGFQDFEALQSRIPGMLSEE